MSDEWKVGEVVRLKSGGPLMTVAMPMNNGFVPCIWFPDNIAVREWGFAPETIERHVPTKAIDPGE